MVGRNRQRNHLPKYFSLRLTLLCQRFAVTREETEIMREQTFTDVFDGLENGVEVGFLQRLVGRCGRRLTASHRFALDFQDVAVIIVVVNVVWCFSRRRQSLQLQLYNISTTTKVPQYQYNYNSMFTERSLRLS